MCGGEMGVRAETSTQMTHDSGVTSHACPLVQVSERAESFWSAQPNTTKANKHQQTVGWDRKAGRVNQRESPRPGVMGTLTIQPAISSPRPPEPAVWVRGGKGWGGGGNPRLQQACTKERTQLPCPKAAETLQPT